MNKSVSFYNTLIILLSNLMAASKNGPIFNMQVKLYGSFCLKMAKRVKVGTDICRIFYFHHKDTLYVATSGYIKKEMKTDHGEIEKAQKLRKIFIEEMLQ